MGGFQKKFIEWIFLYIQLCMKKVLILLIFQNFEQ